MSLDQILFYISVYVPPLLFAITLHEAAHGYAARYFGDNSAYAAGRLSLNPVHHIDPIGTIALPLIFIVMGTPFIFGWAKPVPVDIGRLHNPKRDMMYVAAAGPLANLMMAFLWAVVLRLLIALEFDSEVLMSMCIFGIKINIILMLFNLFPIPPLDGGRILVGLLPMRAAIKLASLEPYGMFIVVALLAVGAFEFLFKDLFIGIIKVIFYLVGL
ncbi:site-2 protease family protein [Pelistega europaea]|uniref:Site-2 protease family protein n=1 Tax=Pelistega europaea TaxID=106147 RepID=A0A7Y4L860_9BURK|nr:site-2 protease family protein [Pelistega europaea]NOL48668.1 site-2 protease family protein [Pelistega europaea]